ncbi:outer membrane beta-barrel protein [Roseateles chitosanitabidus]|jgi:OOP family OmpA-OmpF porin|uniref:outer membrane beta-barrel protein n=1 Tax=Roseateles chitosanitabidus TaxID=65048 RepID=UPI00082C5CA8|nr:outer membrane beta-barrel protein [Roseateles chitosanitabidus]MBO9686670.1 outer membrane beta-barrel protein [Roseateles chitosanitabidus]
MTKNNRTALLAAAALALTLGSGLAKAADTPYYIGGDVAKSSQRVGGDSQKRSADSYSIFGGYKFNENFAVEANYTDLGSINFNGINAKNKVYSLDGIARAPLGAGFGVYGKVGVAYADRKFDSGLGSEHKTGLKLGVGVDYALTKNVSLRAEATRFNNMPDANGFNKKTDRLGVGLAYQF